MAPIKRGSLARTLTLGGSRAEGTGLQALQVPETEARASSSQSNHFSSRGGGGGQLVWRERSVKFSLRNTGSNR